MQYQLLKSSKLDFTDCCETEKSRFCSSIKYRTGRILSLPDRDISLELCCSTRTPASCGTWRGWRGVEWCSPRRYGGGSRWRLCCCLSASGAAPAGSCPFSPRCPHLPAPCSTVFQLKNPSEKSAGKKRSFFSHGLVLWPCPSHQLHKHWCWYSCKNVSGPTVPWLIFS